MPKQVARSAERRRKNASKKSSRTHKPMGKPMNGMRHVAMMRY